jgi:hypothetical protein
MKTFINSQNNLYRYRISYRYSPPRCTFPKEEIKKPFRMNIVYVNNDDKIIKSIIYPKELLYQQVLPDDIIENEIIQIKHYYPDWDKIEIINKTEFDLNISAQLK